MSNLPFLPYGWGDLPARGSVPLTALILTRDEEANIDRCLASLAWCSQLLVVDSGSTDRTTSLAIGAGADVVTNPWNGYGAQRQWALGCSYVANDWVWFVDADEWASADLAAEIAHVVAEGRHEAYEHRLRLVFLGRWIAHCGWYPNSWVVRLGRREALSFDTAADVGERAVVAGTVSRLENDIVDEDLKGLRSWLHKHVNYASMEAHRRGLRRQGTYRLASEVHRPRSRTFLKEVIFPRVPLRPLALFVYMYLLREGFRDGRQGLAFCLLHAWHEFTIGQLRREGRSTSG